MDQQLNLIFELKDLKKTYKENTVLDIGRLQFHRGAIYGIVGPIGSGKTTLLNIMAGLDRQSSGTIKYDNNEFKTNWFGKIKQNPDIKLAQLESLPKVSKVSEVINTITNQSADQIYPKYLQKGSVTSLMNRKISDLSTGELYWLNMVIAVESDTRVLMIDNYGIFFEKNIYPLRIFPRFRKSHLEDPAINIRTPWRSKREIRLKITFFWVALHIPKCGRCTCCT